LSNTSDKAIVVVVGVDHGADREADLGLAAQRCMAPAHLATDRAR
jgi:hypothetical protein